MASRYALIRAVLEGSARSVGRPAVSSASSASSAVSNRLPRHQQYPLQQRFMSGHGTVEENLAEMAKWRNVSFVAVPVCVLLAAYVFGTAEHHEHHEKAV